MILLEFLSTTVATATIIVLLSHINIYFFIAEVGILTLFGLYYSADLTALKVNVFE